MKLALALFSALLFASCASRVPAPELPARFAGDLEDHRDGWADVLERHVDETGRIDFEGIRAKVKALGLVRAQITTASPESHPELWETREAAIAWWCDTYNALAVWNVLYSGVLPKAKIRFFGLRKHEIGGRDLTLYELENDVIRKLGEERIHFALNCMVRDCPRLPREPFQYGSLDERLDAAAREFLNDPRRVRIDEDAIWVSPILDWYKEDFLAVAPSLAAYINRYRELPLPEDRPLRFMDYDWTLNAQTH